MGHLSEIYTPDYADMTSECARAALAEGRVVAHYTHALHAAEDGNRIMTSLIAYPTMAEAEAAAAIDTRGQCYSVWEETWGEIAEEVEG